MEQKFQKREQNQEELQANKGRSRFLSYLNLKDVFDPIVINRIQIVKSVGILLLVTVACVGVWNKYFKAPTGTQLVDKMVVAAGNMETWNNLGYGKFTRTQRLYAQTGEKLSEKVENLYFEKKNGEIELLIESNRPGKEPLVIGKDAEGFWALEDGKFVDARKTAKAMGMMCDSKWCQPNCDMKMAFYRFSMPFKLKDNGVVAENGGKTQLLDKTYQVVNIGYRPEVGKDKWVFYIDEKTHLIAKMEYIHKTDKGDALPEEFFWTDYKPVGGLNISQKWVRYWSNGKPLEETTFSDFDFQTTLPESFHTRPTHLMSATTSK